MSFLKITDPKKRDETIQEYLRMKKSIQKQSFDKLLADKNIYTQGEKLFKPIIDTQKEESEKITKELQNVATSLEPLSTLPTFDAAQKAIEAPPMFKGVELWDIATKALSESLGKQGEYDNVTGIYKNPTDGKFYIGDSKRTNALKSEKVPRRPKTNKGWKWKELLKPIWTEQKERESPRKRSRASTPKKGNGVTFLPSDPINLLEQLKLSFASNQAGNTGERNRIVSILEALLGMGEIERDDYKKFNLMIK
ncbi:unnamed protein product [Porites evermanni]|uniref:Uncharacterized protein n=1 Tax=Porites evermanni TaxID=104178 RepID=A0ABN8SX47_9CNID|nr:unnamed protein product [Porites evermanni]